MGRAQMASPSCNFFLRVEKRFGSRKPLIYLRHATVQFSFCPPCGRFGGGPPMALTRRGKRSISLRFLLAMRGLRRAPEADAGATMEGASARTLPTCASCSGAVVFRVRHSRAGWRGRAAAAAGIDGARRCAVGFSRRGKFSRRQRASAAYAGVSTAGRRRCAITPAGGLSARVIAPIGLRPITDKRAILSIMDPEWLHGR